MPVKQNQWILTKPLAEEVALKENLTLAMAVLLMPGRESLESISSSNDRRAIPDSIAWSYQEEVKSSQAGITPESGNAYLLLLFFIVLFTERIIAYNRNQ